MNIINTVRMKTGICKFVNRGSASGKSEKRKLYDSFFLYFPSEVARDSNFPFESGDKIKVTIEADNQSVRLEKVKKDQQNTG